MNEAAGAEGRETAELRSPAARDRKITVAGQERIFRQK